MKKFKKLKPLSDTGKPTISIWSMDSTSMLPKKPNTSKSVKTKLESTAKTKLTNYP
jgi:hypothetical protein